MVIAAGERASVALPLALPERPSEVVVSGRLLFSPGWEEEELALLAVPWRLRSDRSGLPRCAAGELR